MDILLRKKYSFILPDSFEETKKKLEIVSSNRFDTFSSRLPQIVDKDGAFSLRANFSFFSVLNYGQTTYLKGQISAANNGTKITIVLSPNIGFPLTVYFLALASTNVLFGDNSLLGSQGGRLFNIILIIIMEIALLSIAQISSHFMKPKFEKAIGIRNPLKGEPLA